MIRHFIEYARDFKLQSNHLVVFWLNIIKSTFVVHVYSVNTLQKEVSVWKVIKSSFTKGNLYNYLGLF